jgi:hypothetical protein
LRFGWLAGRLGMNEDELPGGQRKRANNRGSSGDAGLGNEGRSNHIGAITHNSQTHTGGDMRFGWQSFAIIVDRQLAALRPGFQHDFDLVGFSMFDAVGNRFLRYAIWSAFPCLMLLAIASCVMR